ncbi:MAG: hypothetical protein DMF49_01020 [Acidobacteria bacterium]|nr:MAG: hypothetical protein DMF49_01020 [Acidobacteriota bacterium]
MSSQQDSIASAHDRAGERSRLRVAIILTAFILLLEAAGGLYSNSLALLSDAGHVMTDLAGLLLCYGALALALRPATARKTYGWYRIEILAALVNGALLFALAVGIFLESVRRLQHPPTVLTLPMMLTAGLGLVVNVAAMTVLLRGRSNINLRGALIHVFGDTLSSVGVLHPRRHRADPGGRRDLRNQGSSSGPRPAHMEYHLGHARPLRTCRDRGRGGGKQR